MILNNLSISLKIAVIYTDININNLIHIKINYQDVEWGRCVKYPGVTCGSKLTFYKNGTNILNDTRRTYMTLYHVINSKS